MAHGITHVGYPSGVIDLPTGFLRPNRITAVLSNVHTPGIVPDDAILTEAEEILNLENELYLALDEGSVSFWTPASLTTENWYDAADTSTITDTSGVVTQWDDKSGNANHLSTNGSTISTNSRTLNSTNVMDVVEGTRFEKFPYQLPADCSIFMVAGIDFVNNGNDSLIGITGGAAKNFQFDSGDIVGVQDQFFARFNQTGIGTTNTFSPTTDQKGPSIYELIFDLNGDSDLEVFIDGTSFGTTTYNAQCGPSSTLLLFSNRGGGTLNDGLIGEVIIVPSVLSASDREKMEGYLAHKWGLTSNLDASHPYKTSRPLAESAFLNETSVDFDGANDYMSTDLGLTPDSYSAYSFGGWAKFDSFTNGGGPLQLTQGASLISWPENTFIRVNSATSMQPYHADDSTYRYANATYTLSLGTWHHFVQVWDGSDVKLYIDGALRGSISSVTSWRDGGNTVKLLAGFARNGYHNGKVDEVFWFSSALSASDITSIYNSGLPADLSSYNPVGWWRMGDDNSGSGTTITDQGSGSNDGTLINGPTFSTDVPS